MESLGYPYMADGSFKTGAWPQRCAQSARVQQDLRQGRALVTANQPAIHFGQAGVGGVGALLQIPLFGRPSDNRFDDLRYQEKHDGAAEVFAHGFHVS